MNKTPAASCIKGLLKDENFSFSLNFKIAQRLYTHPVVVTIFWLHESDPL